MIKTEIKEILSKQLGKKTSDIGDDADLVALGADSLDMVEIVIELESHFNVIIEEDEAAQATTVDAIAKLINEKLAK